jgi:hypothetical protein
MPSWSARTKVRVSPDLWNPLPDAENFCFAEFTITQRLRSAAREHSVERASACLLLNFADSARKTDRLKPVLL